MSSFVNSVESAIRGRITIRAQATPTSGPCCTMKVNTLLFFVATAVALSKYLYVKIIIIIRLNNIIYGYTILMLNFPK